MNWLLPLTPLHSTRIDEPRRWCLGVWAACLVVGCNSPKEEAQNSTSAENTNNTSADAAAGTVQPLPTTSHATTSATGPTTSVSPPPSQPEAPSSPSPTPPPSTPSTEPQAPNPAPTTAGDAGGAAPVEPTNPVDNVPIAFDVFWDFEAADGDTIADATGEHLLQLAGAALTDGPTGQQLSLSGANSSATLDSVPIDTTGDFSISAWVRLEQLESYSTFVGLNGEEVSAVFLQKRSDDRLALTTFPTDSTSAEPCITTAQIQPRPGEWYHVVGTRHASSGEQRLYVDGVLSGQSACAAEVFAAQTGLSLGYGVYGSAPADWVNGGVDELGLLSRVMNPAEVLSLYRAGRPDADHYLFAYFVEVTEGRGDGLRLAHSHDGQHWGAIGQDKVFMPPSVGGGSFRDPHLLRGPDGVYHLVWTTSCVPWAEANCVQDRGLGHATSPNLVDWSEADYITIDLNVEHVWAPETFYDAESEQYLLFWSSPLDATSGSDPHSIYYVLTRDFQSFSTPEILYSQPGRNFIDATLRRDAEGYLMIIKDEADGEKNLRALRSVKVFGPDAWQSAPSAPLTGNYAAEGPSLLERDGVLFIYFDKYGEGAYGALRATTASNLDDPASWQDVSSSVFFPGVRHGTPIRVPWDVFEAVALAAGK